MTKTGLYEQILGGVAGDWERLAQAADCCAGLICREEGREEVIDGKHSDPAERVWEDGLSVSEPDATRRGRKSPRTARVPISWKLQF